LYLYGYHLRLLFLNQTTHESLKNTNIHQRASISNVFLRLKQYSNLPSYVKSILKTSRTTFKNKVREEIAPRPAQNEGNSCCGRTTGLDFFKSSYGDPLLNQSSTLNDLLYHKKHDSTLPLTTTPPIKNHPKYLNETAS
jgi:hypothetical protein